MAKDPRHPGALLLLAEMAATQRRAVVAERLAKMAVDEPPRTGEPDHRPAALNLLGQLLAESGRVHAAVQTFAKAATLQPVDPGPLRNLAKARWLSGELDEAVGDYSAAAERLPLGADERLAVLRDLVSLHHARLDTRSAVEVRRRIVAERPGDLAAGSDLLVALHYLPDVSPAELFEAHREWGRRACGLRATEIAQPGERAGRPRSERIAYFSGDFREYPMSRFLAPVLSGHRDGNAPRPAITLYSDTQKPDAVTALLAARADAWVDVSGMTDGQLVDRLERDDPDLLVDLAGHMDNRRMPALARARVRRRVSYINYPNTLGVAGWDWRLTDAIADPPGDADVFHLERLVRLDSCAWAYDPTFGLNEPLPVPGEAPVVRNGHVTFGVLARAAKLIPEAVRLWAGVLEVVGNARLALLRPAGIDPGVVLRLLSQNGVDTNRVTLLEPGDRTHYLRLHQQIDIVLDTWPYNGMTGTCDALWMGVPVITLAGDRHVSRVGASLLSAVGIPQYIGRQDTEYVQIASILANEVQALSQLRASLRNRFLVSPLGNGRRVAVQIERLSSENA